MTNPLIHKRDNSIGIKQMGQEPFKVSRYTEIVKSAGDAALFMQVASDVGVMAKMIVDPELAASVHRCAAYDTNERSSNDEEQAIPEEWANAARSAVANGGALISLTTYGDKDLSEFWHKVNDAKSEK